MPSSEYPARGKVIAVRDGILVFAPTGTSYELHLTPAGGRYDGPIDQRIEAFIHASATKVMTVPSGGSFVVPIFGPPLTLQGRIRYLDDRQMVVQAGTPVIVDLPAADSAYDLPNGPLAVGAMVNVTLTPGLTIEVLPQTVAR